MMYYIRTKENDYTYYKTKCRSDVINWISDKITNRLCYMFFINLKVDIRNNNLKVEEGKLLGILSSITMLYFMIKCDEKDITNDFYLIESDPNSNRMRIKVPSKELYHGIKNHIKSKYSKLEIIS